MGVVFAVVFTSLTCVSAQAIVELTHAHGIGYSADGRQILVPNHYGIAVFSEGRWSKIPHPANDYMGFVVTRDFIFTSGHLEGSRGAANPLRLTTLAFGGAVEADGVSAVSDHCHGGINASCEGDCPSGSLCATADNAVRDRVVTALSSAVRAGWPGALRFARAPETAPPKFLSV